MRRRKGALKPKTLFVTLAICGIIALAGIGYVWAKTEVYSLAREVKSLEIKLDELHRTNEALKQQFAVKCTQGELQRQARSLGLAAPTPDQIVKLQDPVPSVSGQSEPRAFAAKLE
jgi:cell division protein FtsL